MITPADLIKEHNTLDDWLKAESKRFTEHLKPALERQKAINAELHTLLLQQNGGDAEGGSNIKTSAGTAYLSRIMTLKITNQEQYLDWVLENYPEWGAMLQISLPKKETVREYLDKYEGKSPPFVEVDYFIKCNINRA